MEVDSAGLNLDAVVALAPEQLEWADLILVMEKTHVSRLNRKFRPYLRGKRAVVLNIPDEYDYMDPALIRLLEGQCAPYLPGGKCTVIRLQAMLQGRPSGDLELLTNRVMEPLHRLTIKLHPPTSLYWETWILSPAWTGKKASGLSARRRSSCLVTEPRVSLTDFILANSVGPAAEVIAS